MMLFPAPLFGSGAKIVTEQRSYNLISQHAPVCPAFAANPVISAFLITVSGFYSAALTGFVTSFFMTLFTLW
ncbi:hypothetical protein ABIC12_002841 [Pantoea agglomerans]|uniref:hypothetical protein n=1 Tax=Enterobacter agglomerans TaxID=549 RepID=UPI0013B5EF67|nr:hypothetical protein [Pantoea agglomerans]MDQ0431180.1 hypothetical protein [Pantoea agglomerans]NEG84944.1 hypothetical protein [Pantoea agglomerans]NEH09760.1 hypothetical protein [Pantoea agglomerans]